MTIAKFQRLLQKVNPKLKVRVAGYGDVAGLFAGRFGRMGYIARMSKGELHLDGYRFQVVDPKNNMRLIDGHIRKRGRKTLIRLLRSWGWIKTHRQVSMLSWGIERDE